MSLKIGSLIVTAAPARHAVPENTYVIKHSRGTVFFGADTLLIPELEDVARRFPNFDLALLLINGLRLKPLLNRKVVMDGREAAKLCSILKPRVAVPIHYAFHGGPVADRLLLGYDRLTGTPNAFKRLAAGLAPQIHVEVLEPRCAFRLEPSVP